MGQSRGGGGGCKGDCGGKKPEERNGVILRPSSDLIERVEEFLDNILTPDGKSQISSSFSDGWGGSFHSESLSTRSSLSKIISKNRMSSVR